MGRMTAIVWTDPDTGEERREDIATMGVSITCASGEVYRSDLLTMVLMAKISYGPAPYKKSMFTLDGRPNQASEFDVQIWDRGA